MLKGALHLTDYVTMVMKRLSGQNVNPKVVFAFVLHPEENLRPDSAQRRIAPYRLRYQGDGKAQ